MKKLMRPSHLPLVTTVLGAAAFALRLLVYRFAVDEKNLLSGNHPLELLLAAVTAAALLYILIVVRRLDGSNEYEANFHPDFLAAAGHVLAASGILVTVLTNAPVMEGYLGTGWQLLGFAAPVCLILAGYFRLRGKRPFFLLHLIPCGFLVLHIVNHYQTWSGNPQLQDYIFALLGTMALVLFAFYNAAFDAEVGNRRMQMGMGLAAVFLCMAELGVTRYVFLYLGGIIWAMTDLCSAYPRPRKQDGESGL